MFIRILKNDNHAFGPEEIDTLNSAFLSVLRTLELSNRDDPETITVARCIIELAKRGERDPLRLQSATLKALRRDGTAI